MSIRVLSFDFDGCLFRKDFTKSGDIIEKNEDFLSTIKEENAGFDKVYTCIGSSRQSLVLEESNSASSNGIGRCFPAMEEISESLGVELDPFLLADIYDNVPDGTSYHRTRAYQKSGRNPYRSEVPNDKTKASILYSQIHHSAKKNCNQGITFDFYDDMLVKEDKNKDILGHLQDFYSKNPFLIPANVTLRLHHYAGEGVTLLDEIKGTGFIDENYRQTVKDLNDQAKLNRGMLPYLSVAECVDPNNLKNRIPLSESGSKERFAAALGKIAQKAKELEEKAGKFEEGSKSYQSYKDAAEAAFNLHKSLEDASEEYYKGNQNKETFKQTVDEAIKVAEDSALKNHRGYLKQILAYTGLAVLAVLTVATAGLAYAVAGGANYAMNRQFFFSRKVNTDSLNKVLDVKKAADNLVDDPKALVHPSLKEEVKEADDNVREDSKVLPSSPSIKGR